MRRPSKRGPGTGLAPRFLCVCRKSNFQHSPLEPGRGKNKKMNKIHKLTLLAICFLENFATFAQPHTEVEVNSFGEYDMNGKTYVIIPANDNIDENDLEFKEYSSYIKKILATAGARECSEFLNADICVLMHYEIANQSYSETVSVPVWGKTGISSISTNTYSTGSSNTYANANVSVYGNSAYGSGNSYTNGSSNTTSTTNVNYSYGISGYRNVQRHVDNYLRVLNLYAYENKDVEKPVMVWKTNIMSDGYTNNLRPIIPAMSYGILGCVGSNVQGTWNVYDNNLSFQFFCKFKINGENIYAAPVIDYFASDERLKIIAIERKPNETIVTFHKAYGLPTVFVSSKMYLEFDGNKLYPLSSENIKLGKTVRNSRNLFFSVHYPAIPKDIKIINISEEDDLKIKNPRERKYWKGIHLNK